MKMKRTLAAIVAASTLLTGQSPGQLYQGQGRIAVTADGNIHDKDDYGATAISLAIIARRGLQNKLVHFDYNSHIGETVAAQEAEMRISALEGADQFGFDRGVFFDAIRNLSGAIGNLRSEINASSANDPLFVILSGPSEILWRALNQATASRRQHVVIISHGPTFNETHAGSEHNGKDIHGGPHSALRRTMTDIRSDFPTVGYERIRNQNDVGWNPHKTANRYATISWMRDHPRADMRWAYTRIEAVRRADYSDAGKLYWLFTGDEEGDNNDQRNFFSGTWPPKPGTGSSLPRNTPIVFKGNNNRFISSENGNGPMTCSRSGTWSWQRFTAIDVGGGKIALRGNNGRYVSSENGNGSMTCTRSGTWSWQQFTVVNQGPNQIALRGNNGRFVSSENGSRPIRCNRTSAGNQETFTWSRP